MYRGGRQLAQPSALPQPLRCGDVRFFSYGRFALREALTLADVEPGDVVLLPEYICRENLAAVHALGARVEYYPVNEALELAVSPSALPQGRAVLAVNYFGFPQDLSPFRAYCSRAGAMLIEDNAHGFLSRDEGGAYLGARGDLGIFSFRKSIPLVNGSGLLVNNPEKTGPISPQLPFVSYPESRTFRVKKYLRRVPKWNMAGLLYALICMDRAVRKFRTGSDYLKSAADSELVLPGSANPDANLLPTLTSLDVSYEITRRRSLYAEIGALVESSGGTPLFAGLPEHVVPYGYPFRSTPDAIGRVKKALNANYLECYQWPELPSEIEPRASEHYRSVWLVNFLW